MRSQSTNRISKMLPRCTYDDKNSGVTGGGGQRGRVSLPPPETSDREISADLLGKKRQGKKGKGVKIEKKRRKIVKGKVEKLQNEVRTWGLFFFFFFFCFSLFKPLRFVLGLLKWKFSTKKKHFTPGKKIRKNYFAPSQKFSC